MSGRVIGVALARGQNTSRCRTEWQIGIYLGNLWLILGLATPWADLVTLPIQFFLKDRLHLGPQQVAIFGAVTAIPLYLGLLFGLLRDGCRPFGEVDRRCFLLGAPCALAAYLWLAAHPLSFLWNFSPISQTPYFYHLTQTVRVSSERYGLCLALFAAACIPGAILYGCLCRHLPLHRLLKWAAAVAVLHVPPYLLCQTASGATAVAGVTGCLCGFGYAAFRDLLFRSCPRGLEGTATALAASAVIAAIKGGDLFGTWLYLRGGFAIVVLATLFCALLLVPIVRLVPPEVAACRDAEFAS